MDNIKTLKCKKCGQPVKVGKESVEVICWKCVLKSLGGNTVEDNSTEQE